MMVNNKKVKLSNNLILLIVLIGIVIFFSIAEREFISFNNISSMLKNMVIAGVIALGLTPLMITRGVDISLGSSLSFTSVVMAIVYNMGVNIWLILLLGLAITTIIGFINGFFITKYNINALIFTIGMMAILQSLALVASDLESIPILPDELYWFGTANFLKVPVLVWCFIILSLIYWVVLKFTIAGRWIYAIGGNPHISNLFGIKVNKIKLLLHTLFGVSVGFATIIMISLSGVGNPYHGFQLPLPIISGVILGGISFMSVGSGSVWGTVIGLLIVNSIFNGLSVMNVPSFYLQSLQGLIFISVVAAYEIRDRNKKKYIG